MKCCVALVIVCLVFSSMPTIADDYTGAKTLVRASLDKMGGVERFQNLKAISNDMLIIQYLNEQSESPDVEPLMTHAHIYEVRDYANDRTISTRKTMGLFSQSSEWSGEHIVVFEGGINYGIRGEQKFPWNPAGSPEESLLKLLTPERILVLALQADDTKLARMEQYQGVQHYVVTFTWVDHTFTLKINSGSKLLSCAETLASFDKDLFWQGWGDLNVQVQFSNWWRDNNGFAYPMKWDQFRDEWHYLSYVILNAQIDPDLDDLPAPLSQEECEQYAAQMKAMEAGARAPRENEELAPGIIQLRGLWNTALVEQSDGVVVFESPMFPFYSESIIAEAKQRFPDKDIKAVISTSDAWPHIGGMRQYVAEGIPVYILDLNLGSVNRLINSSHTLKPDALAKSPRQADLRLVSSTTTLGDGPNRMVLVPARGEGSERMMLVYFPEHKLLYGSDLIQMDRDGSIWSKQYASEIVDVVDRESFTVERIFNMHTGPQPWSWVLENLNPKSGEEQTSAQQ